MKLTKIQPQVEEKKVEWNIGDWFIVDMPGEEVFLRRIEYRDGCFSMRNINGICKFLVSGIVRNVDDAMAEYLRAVGPATKVEIKEVIFEEVIE